MYRIPDVLGKGEGGPDSPCLLEAVSMFAGEECSHRPECVDEDLVQVGWAVNDALRDEDRQDLLRYIPLFVGTKGDGDGMRRAERIVAKLSAWLDEITPRQRARWALEHAAANDITHAAQLRLASGRVEEGEIGHEMWLVTEALGDILPYESLRAGLVGLLDEVLGATVVPASWAEATAKPATPVPA